MNEKTDSQLMLQSVDAMKPSVVAAPAAIEGIVERIVFESEESGFLVGRLREHGKPDLVTFVGNALAISPGETIRLWGRWVDDKKFGHQLRIERYETIQPCSTEAIERYLGSGLLRGVGPATAKKLVDAFGLDTLRVIDEEPNRIASIRRLGAKRAEQIRDAWAAQKTVQSIMLFLQGHGISVSQATKIYKKYGDAAVSVLRENPYRLAEDIHGIAFKSADAIAKRLGMSLQAPQRIQAGLLYELYDASSDGHVYLPSDELIERTARLLTIPAELIKDALPSAIANKTLLRDGDCIYAPSLFYSEAGCDRLLKRLLSAQGAPVSINIDKAIEWVEKQKTIVLSPEQRESIRAVVSSKVTVITGGPGTGKTTVLNSLVAILEKKHHSIALTAPTGRAAKRLSETTGRDARTIHRLLEFSPKTGMFLRNENNPLDCEFLIVDEASMIDIRLMHQLLKAVAPQARLIVVGDVDQLPSVGPGSVLLDIISSGRAPVVWLKTVFRQAAQSGIITNAHLINEGKYPAFNTTDFFFVERKDPSKALDTIVDLATKRIPDKFNLDPIKDVQVLAPMHRGDVGVARLNEALQATLNPRGEQVSGRNFRKGDKVMQTRNNYELEVFNGDIGIVSRVDEVTGDVLVAFDDRIVQYEQSQLDDMTLAYAASIHKAQGSEYPAVVIPLLTQHYMMLTRNILYTGITRASKIVVLVGDPKAVGIAVRNTKVVKRYSRLADRLRNINDSDVQLKGRSS